MIKKVFLAMTFMFLVTVKAVCQQQQVYVTNIKNPDNTVDFTYVKDTPGTYFVEIELGNVENVKNTSDLKTVYSFNLTGKTGSLFRLYPENSNRPIFSTYSYTFKKGAIEPAVDYSIDYLLPFKADKKVEISELGRYNVSTDIWKNYVYFSKTKDTIYGMRKGTVVDIRKFVLPHEKLKTAEIEYKTEIIVEHADGTNASYIGLDPDLLQVKLNDIIYPQTPIGVMDNVLDVDGNRTFKFNVYYFSNEEVTNLHGRKMALIQKSVVPYFLTSTGKERLKPYKEYIVKWNNNSLYQEMTPEEKEKFNYSSQFN